MTAPLSLPRPLAPGDLIRVIAPASPFHREDLEAGARELRAWGYRVSWREDIVDRAHYLAGSPARRAEELHEAFEDPRCKAILVVRGGYGLTTLLPLLDSERITPHPKLLVGCSDVTALLEWLRARCGMACFHGPMVGSVGRGKDPVSSAALRALLDGSAPPREIRSALPSAESWCVSPGQAKGDLVGGSLSLLAATCGTPWQVDSAGKLLLLEDVGERPYRVDRLLTQIEGAGLLDGVAGVLLGDFVDCDEPGGRISWRDPVERVLRRLPVPILVGLPFGHGRPNLPLPIGVRAEMDAGAGLLRIRGRCLAR